jgi:hypothetical protein
MTEKLMVRPEDKVKLEAGWVTLSNIPIDRDEKLEEMVVCMDRNFPAGTPRVDVWAWFETMGFWPNNRMNGINPFYYYGTNPDKTTQEDCDAIISQSTMNTYIWLYMRDLEALILTVKIGGVEVNFVSYAKVVSTLKLCVEKKMNVKIQPWLMDEVRALQASENKQY